MKHHLTARIGIKHAIDDDTVKVNMRVEQCAETVDEDDCPQAGLCACVRTAMPQRPLDGAQKEM